MIDKNGKPSANETAPGCIVVHFRNGVNVSQIEQIIKDNGGTLALSYSDSGSLCCHINVQIGSEDALVIKFKDMSEVLKVSRVYLQGYL